MRVGVYYSNSDLRVEDRPKPRIGAGEVLLRIEASGICGSDLMEWYRIHRAPLVLGHEVAGEVVETGGGVDAFKAGDRVTATHHVPCLTCHFCKSGHETTCDLLRTTNFDPGGFSEFVRMPGVNVPYGILKLPEQVSFEEGAFVEPIGCAARGLRLARLREGQSVLVIGTGASGLLYVHVARAKAAGWIGGVDTVEKRRAAAKEFGADSAWGPEEPIPERIKERNEGRLADLVILCAGGLAAASLAFRCVERGGTVLISAPVHGHADVPLPFNDLFWRNEITLTSTYGSAPADSVEALRLLSEGRLRVSDMITHRIGLDEIGQGFKLAASPAESLKVMIYPQQ